MSSSRDYTIIRTNKTQEQCQKEMSYPYWYINSEYETRYLLDNIRKHILTEKKEDRADAGDFPRNIQEHFWVECGERDERPWISCGQLTNGAYFFYTGSCDYTGFDCQGGMRLWLSTSWNNIVDHAMTEGDYEQYRRQNEPQEEEEDHQEEDHQEEEYEDRGTCAHCHQEAATMTNDLTDEEGDLCADCFWDIDAEMKRMRRQDPGWRYSRVYSACKVLLNMDEAESRAKAKEEVLKMEGGSWWLTKNILEVS
jgi:hypothetical protein